MGLRKATAYSHKYARPYTRKSSVKSKSYIKAVPPSKVVKYTIGDVKKFRQGLLKYKMTMISKEPVQLRDNAIEAARTALIRHLELKIPGSYYATVDIHPHHILRENKMLTGAGADRMQTGMSQSFGATVGRAAFVKEGKSIFTLYVADEKAVAVMRLVFDMIRPKLTCDTKLIVEKI